MNILKVFTDKRIKGNIGEEAVARYLRRRFFRIVERNYVLKGHEVDIIAQNRRYLCFVEVKARTVSPDCEAHRRPSAAVDRDKMKSILTVARNYLYSHPTKRKIRLDVAEVYLANDSSIVNINYIEGAFKYNDAFIER